MEHMKILATYSLDKMRMPKAATEDADMTTAAMQVLAADGITKDKLLRLVLSTEKTRREKKEGSITPGTVNATVEIYHYVWEQFQVATAEKEGDEVWIYYTTFKKFESGGMRTPLNRWILSGRFKSTPILEKNVGL
jgi:hypothetical protein